MSDALKLKVLTWLLRFSAAMLMLAFLAMVMPSSWMERGHAALDVGAYPQSPVYEYLARSISLLYGLHGVLMLIVSFDLVRYRPLVGYLGGFDLVFGASMLGIDLAAGMPTWWVVIEGPPLMGSGVVLLWLRRAIPERWSPN